MLKKALFTLLLIICALTMRISHDLEALVVDDAKGSPKQLTITYLNE